jgi:hypothetical protein
MCKSCREPDRQRVDDDPVAECRAQLECDPIAEDGANSAGSSGAIAAVPVSPRTV